MIYPDDAIGLENVSPAVLREQARREWDARFAATCACDPRIEGVRFEAAGMECGRCGRRYVIRRST